MTFSAGSPSGAGSVRPETIAALDSSADPADRIGPADPARPDPVAERREDPPGWRRALLVSLPAWVLGHLVVIAVSVHISPHHPLAALMRWDTVWYRYIAANGYNPGGSLTHFFPLTPVSAGALAWATRIPVTVALFGFCWIAALFFGAALYRLTFFETGDRDAARRASWLIQLTPGAYALAMGYTEPLAGLLAVGYFFALRLAAAQGHGVQRDAWRRRAMIVAVITGLLSGVARPTGVVLVVAGLVEGWRFARRTGWRPSAVLQAAIAAAAPAIGLFGYLCYARVSYGSWTLPLSQQVLKSNRGGVVNDPLTSLHFWLSGSREHSYGPHIAALAVILIVACIVLIVPVARRLAFSYFAWVVPMFVLAISSQSFTSMPRYVGALFPLVMVLAVWARRRRQEAAVYVACIGLLVWASHIVLSLRLIA